jgi:hypothetical protein
VILQQTQTFGDCRETRHEAEQVKMCRKDAS